jgi:hypothetical protein
MSPAKSSLTRPARNGQQPTNRAQHRAQPTHLRNLKSIASQYDANNDAGPVTWADYSLALALGELAGRVEALEQLATAAPIAAAACRSLLTGDPDPGEFDPAELEAVAQLLEGVRRD